MRKTMTFDEHKKATKEDCEALSEMIKEVANSASEGNMDSFERFFIEGGTNEGDAKINELLERIAIRFYTRKELIK